MNGWDFFTWLNCVFLAVAAITIFGFFLKDARGILTGERSDLDGEQTEAQPEADPDRS
jgi:hypothetical protein